MSQENVEVVRAHFDAFNRGDFEQVVAYFRDDVELEVSVSLPEPGKYFGSDAVEAWFANYFGSFEPGYSFRLEEVFEAGGAVVVIARHHGFGRRSGVETSGQSGYVYWVEGGEIARVALYRERSEALEAAGLSE